MIRRYRRCQTRKDRPVWNRTTRPVSHTRATVEGWWDSSHQLATHHTALHSGRQTVPSLISRRFLPSARARRGWIPPSCDLGPAAPARSLEQRGFQRLCLGVTICLSPMSGEITTREV